MKSAIPSDLLKLKKRFEAWRETRAKRSKTPDRLLKAAAALLDHYSAPMVCRVCGINLRTLRRRSPSKASSDRESQHRLLILTRDIRQSQISINSQALFLCVPAQKLKFWADDSFPGQTSDC